MNIWNRVWIVGLELEITVTAPQVAFGVYPPTSPTVEVGSEIGRVQVLTNSPVDLSNFKDFSLDPLMVTRKSLRYPVHSFLASESMERYVLYNNLHNPVAATTVQIRSPGAVTGAVLGRMNVCWYVQAMDRTHP